MVSLAHRGLWTARDDRNTLRAFCDAFACGLGVELDVRDLDGSLVVSHDPPSRGALPFARVVDAYRAHGRPGVLAVNVKADGPATLIGHELSAIEPERWFAFDMSVPDTLAYARAQLPFFTRHSDAEPAPAIYARAAGVWLDDFEGGFIEERLIDEHLATGKRVAVVSPELHGRDGAAAWTRWQEWSVWESPAVLLCTDDPLRAREVLS